MSTNQDLRIINNLSSSVKRVVKKYGKETLSKTERYDATSELMVLSSQVDQLAKSFNSYSTNPHKNSFKDVVTSMKDACIALEEHILSRTPTSEFV